MTHQKCDSARLFYTLSFYYLCTIWLCAANTVIAQTKLLDSTELATKPVYQSLKAALRNPERVYIVELCGYYNPPGIDSLLADISKLKNLQILKLPYCQLKKFPKGILNCKNLQILDFQESRFLDVPAEALNKMPHLTSVRLGFNGEKLPDSFAQTKSLTALALRISVQFLTDALKKLSQLPNLRELDISYNPIHILPVEIGQLKALRRLLLANCELTTLPKSIGNLTNLEFLYLAGEGGNNPLINLPNEIGDLVNLQDLHISRGKLTALPASFGKLENLQRLSIDGNKLPFKKLFPFLSSLKSLQYLIIDKPSFQEKQQLLTTHPQLTSLNDVAGSYLAQSADTLREIFQAIKTIYQSEYNKKRIYILDREEYIDGEGCVADDSGPGIGYKFSEKDSIEFKANWKSLYEPLQNTPYEYLELDEGIWSDFTVTEGYKALLQKVDYPFELESKRLQGKVYIRVFIDRKGTVRNHLIEKSDSEHFTFAALKAVNQYIFPVATRKGKPVAYWLTIPIIFVPSAQKK